MLCAEDRYEKVTRFVYGSLRSVVAPYFCNLEVIYFFTKPQFIYVYIKRLFISIKYLSSVASYLIFGTLGINTGLNSA